MVNIAYCLLVHRSPNQVRRLLDRLDNRGDICSVTVFNVKDLRTRDNWERLLLSSDCFVVHTSFVRKPSYARFGLVQATLDAMQHLNAHEYDYFVNLSGQCYPIKPIEVIKGRLSKGNATFMEAKKYPDEEPRRDKVRRLTDWNFVAGSGANIRIVRVPNLRPVLPLRMQPYGGSQWFCMKRPHVDHVTKFVADHPKVVRFFRNVGIPNENFFQTILMNSQFNEEIIKDNLRYVAWNKVAVGETIYEESSTRNLTTRDMPLLKQTDKLWARKFDVDTDEEVLNQVDRFCLRNTTRG